MYGNALAYSSDLDVDPRGLWLGIEEMVSLNSETSWKMVRSLVTLPVEGIVIILIPDLFPRE